MRIWPRIRSLFTRPRRSLGAAEFELDPDKARQSAVQKERRQRKRIGDVSPDLQENLDHIRRIFHVPQNSDIVIREFVIGTAPKREAFLFFVEGLSSEQEINRSILRPLMRSATEPSGSVPPKDAHFDDVKAWLAERIPVQDAKNYTKLSDLVDQVLTGVCGLFIDGVDQGIALDTKGWEHRTPERPQSEQVVRGSHEAFVEKLRTNTALVKRRLQTPDLIAETITIGELSKTDVCIMYIHNVVNPDLVDEVRRRVQGIKIDHLGDSGILEQLIEDQPYHLVPSVISTVRPDRVAGHLAEGRTALFVDGNPHVLVVPSTFTSLFHTPEDLYLRWPYGYFARVVRFVAIIIATLTPSLYVALANYHPEMIPTPLLMAIAGSRTAVPLPLPIEVLMMELSFELIREAGIRIPSVVGPTIGIVGALLIGEAAVNAGVVSPIVVIVVATTAISSFAIPSYAGMQTVRIARFGFWALASVLGFLGVSIGIYVAIISLVQLKSFGVPFMAPLAPKQASGPDVIARGPLWQMGERPLAFRPLDRVRQELFVRGWAPSVPDTEDELPPGDDREAGATRKTSRARRSRRSDK